jgi:hypothetical protein
MKSFKTIIAEARVTPEGLKKLHPTIDTSHDSLATHREAGAVIDHFAGADPTTEKKYLPWVINNYKKKNFRQEDSDRIHTALSGFEKHKNKLEQKDINQYKSLGSLEDAVEPHLGSVSKKEEVRNIKMKGAETHHSNNGLTVITPTTEEAAKHYGKGTKWCTSAENENNNQFKNYNNLGPLHIINTPDGEKHQFHFQTDSFMDSRDEEVDLHDMVKKYPELKNVEKFRNNPKYGHNFARTPEEAHKMIHAKIDRAMGDYVDEPDNKDLSDLVDSPHLDKSHLDKITKANRILSYPFRKHPKLDSDHITNLIKGDSENVAVFLAHPNAKKENFDRALNDPKNLKDSRIAKLTKWPEHIEKIMKSGKHSSSMETAIVENPHTPSHILDHLLKSPQEREYPNNLNTTDESHHDKLMSKAMLNPNISNEHIERQINKPTLSPFNSNNLDYRLLLNPALSSEYIHALVKKNPTDSQLAVHHPNVSKKTLEHIRDNYKLVTNLDPITHITLKAKLKRFDKPVKEQFSLLSYIKTLNRSKRESNDS